MPLNTRGKLKRTHRHVVNDLNRAVLNLSYLKNLYVVANPVFSQSYDSIIKSLQEHLEALEFLKVQL